jgi:hypothetical protein
MPVNPSIAIDSPNPPGKYKAVMSVLLRDQYLQGLSNFEYLKPHDLAGASPSRILIDH